MLSDKSEGTLLCFIDMLNTNQQLNTLLKYAHLFTHGIKFIKNGGICVGGGFCALCGGVSMRGFCRHSHQGQRR